MRQRARLPAIPGPTTTTAAQQEGFRRWQMTIRDGRRCGAARAYLKPAMARVNLDVETDALVNRVLLESNRAIGVEYTQGGETKTARAAREVILAGGVINSPQVLMLSGIGDPADLRAHGIAVKAPLPGVGKNLQDHISAGVAYTRKEPGRFHRAMRLDRIARRAGEVVSVRHRARERSARRRPGVSQDRRGREAPRHPVSVQRRLDGGEALSAAVPAGLRRRLRLPRRAAAAAEPRPRRARLRRSARAAAHPAEFLRRRRRPQDAARRHPHGARRRPPVAAGAVRRQGACAAQHRRRDRRAYPRHRHHRPPPGGTCRMGATTRRWSIPSCACAASRPCAWSTPRCSPTSSAATSTRR